MLFDRLTAFDDEWPKICEWFSNYGNVKCVDADNEENWVFGNVDRLFCETMDKVQNLVLSIIV